jgi:signal transduction histidine kinase
MLPHEQKIYILLLIASGVLALILLLFIISLIRNFRAFKKLHREKLIAEIIATEKERRQIAGDIHDDIAPVLAAAKMQISSVDKAQPALIKAMQYIDDVIVQVRGISHALMPAALIRKGLVPALRDHIDSLNAAGTVHIEARMEEVSLCENDVHVYRILHEVLHNALKHAGASLIELKLQSIGREVIIDIRDDGKGASPEKHNGLGMINIRSRVELLNGTMEIQSTPLKGMCYLIVIPAASNEL